MCARAKVANQAPGQCRPKPVLITQQAELPWMCGQQLVAVGRRWAEPVQQGDFALLGNYVGTNGEEAQRETGTRFRRVREPVPWPAWPRLRGGVEPVSGHQRLLASQEPLDVAIRHLADGRRIARRTHLRPAVAARGQ